MKSSFLLLLLSTLSLNALSTELVVYTSRKEHLVKEIFERYSKESGVQVKYKTGKAPALIQTLQAEGENTAADIFMTVDAGNLWHAANKNLLASLESTILTKNVPTHLRDEKNRWFGLSIRARTFVYNTNKTKPAELSSYEDLADPKWKGRLCLRTSKKVYNQSLVAMLIDQLGEKKAEEVVKGWVKNSVEIFSNDTSVIKAVASGQCDVGIVNTYYFGRLMKKEPTLPVKIFWPNQKTYGVHINISGAGVTKYSKNKKEAQKFLEWLASEKAQYKFAQINMENSILDGIEQAGEVKSWGSFKPNNTFSLSKAGALQARAIKLMRRVNYK